MNIIIKDMEIPKACFYHENGHLITCPLHDIDKYCSALHKEASHKENEKLSDCPLAPMVLCKDCMYAPLGTDDGEDRGFGLEWPHDRWPEDNPCPYKCEDGWYSHKPKPEFYCAYGKKEET